MRARIVARNYGRSHQKPSFEQIIDLAAPKNKKSREDSKIYKQVSFRRHLNQTGKIKEKNGRKKVHHQGPGQTAVKLQIIFGRGNFVKIVDVKNQQPNKY